MFGLLMVLWLASSSGVPRVTADSPGHLVRGLRRCGHYFRDTLFTVPKERQFTLTGIGVDFSRERTRLRDSMDVTIYITDARLFKQHGVRFRRGPHAGNATEMLERFPGAVTYGPGDTLVVTLHNVNEEYWQLDGWPRHIVRWEGYSRDVAASRRGTKP